MDGFTGWTAQKKGVRDILHKNFVLYIEKPKITCPS